MNDQCRCIIADSENEPLAHGIVKNPPSDTVWRVQIPDNEIQQVLEHEFVQFIGMSEDLPPMAGRLLCREGNLLLIEPVSELGENARKNLRVPVRFDSFLHPVSGSWRGRLPITCHDLSCGGIAFFCDQPLEIGEVAEVVIPITTQPLLLHIQILRIRPSNSKIPLFAARFVNMIHDQEILVREAVFSQQIRNHANRG